MLRKERSKESLEISSIQPFFKKQFVNINNAENFSFPIERQRPRSHYSVFVRIRFCCIKATVHTAPLSYKNGEKNLRFCAFTLICPITKTQRKTSVFVRSHYSVFVKLIVECWSVFKNLRFCAFTLIKCVFKNLRFCGYPLLTAFSKTSVFVAFLCGSV